MKKILLLSLLLIVTVFLAACTSAPPAPEVTSLAQCLTEKGATMYGTEWCPHCKDQKSKFGSAFKEVNYVDCDKDRALCTAAGITGYPTWVINGEKHPGAQDLYTLAQKAGCELVPQAAAS